MECAAIAGSLADPARNRCSRHSLVLIVAIAFRLRGAVDAASCVYNCGGLSRVSGKLHCFWLSEERFDLTNTGQRFRTAVLVEGLFGNFQLLL